MSSSQSVESYLQNQPQFRERKNKDRGIINLLMRQYATLDIVVESGAIGCETLIAIVQDYATMDRAWRKLLAENAYLRGEDYNDKSFLEERKQMELGYDPGYHQDIKKLKTL